MPHLGSVAIAGSRSCRIAQLRASMAIIGVLALSWTAGAHAAFAAGIGTRLRTPSTTVSDIGVSFPVTPVGQISTLCNDVCFCNGGCINEQCDGTGSGTVTLDYNPAPPFAVYAYTLQPYGSSDCSAGIPVQLPVNVGVGQQVGFTLSFSPTSPGNFSDNLVLSGLTFDLSGSTPPSGEASLVPAALSGWSAPLVVSTTPGTQVDSPTLTSAEPLYLSWSIQNQGDLSTFGTFLIDVDLDGSLLERWSWSDPLQPGWFLYYKDFQFGPLQPGTHTLELVPDPTDVVGASSSTYTKTITVTQASGPVTIASPAAAQDFVLSEASNTATLPITFEAAGAAGTVSWTATLKYQTSGGHPATPYKLTRTFQTVANGQDSETYSSQGGMVTVTASVDGAGSQPGPISFVVTGARIAPADVTARLVDLYTSAGVATPHLMTGVAQVESSYLQFKRRSLYGAVAFWPLESAADGGSHIGLMMMPTASEIDYAWNWQTNTSAGVSLFAQGKLPIAQRKMTTIIQQHPGLRALNGVELEHMALVLYGPAASGVLGKQYYAPVHSKNGWTWAVNTSGNPEGVAYANSCFSAIHKQ